VAAELLWTAVKEVCSCSSGRMRVRSDTREFEKKAQRRAPHWKGALDCSGSSDSSMDKDPPMARGDGGGGGLGGVTEASGGAGGVGARAKR
jgi:hypothetical protein